jgi:hypothetical protein
MYKFIIVLLAGFMLAGCIKSDNKLVIKSENTLPRFFSLNSTIRMPGSEYAGPLDFKWDGEKYVATKEGQKVQALWLAADHGVKFAQLQIQGEEGYWFVVLDNDSGRFTFSVQDAMGIKFSKSQEKFLEKWKVDGIDQKKRAAETSFESIKSSLLFVYIKEVFQIPLLVGADVNLSGDEKFMRKIGTVEVVPSACGQCSSEVRRVVGRWKEAKGTEELRLFEDGSFVAIKGGANLQGAWRAVGGGRYLVKFDDFAGQTLENAMSYSFVINAGNLEAISPESKRIGTYKKIQ